MPRIPRNHMTVSFFHIMTQGIDKEYIFETNDNVFKTFISLYRLYS